MLTGVPAFSGSKTAEVFHSILNKEPWCASLDPPIDSQGVEAICLKAMAKKPEDRYPTPEELARAPRQFLTEHPERRRGFWKRK